jgi:hypothetical protein
MSFASWLLTRLNDTITVAAQSSLSSYGDASFGAQSTLLGRAEEFEGLVELPNGTEQKVRWVVYSQTEIAVTSRVWLPGDNTADNTAARRPVFTERIPSLDGTTDVWHTYFN